MAETEAKIREVLDAAQRAKFSTLSEKPGTCKNTGIIVGLDEPQGFTLLHIPAQRLIEAFEGVEPHHRSYSQDESGTSYIWARRNRIGLIFLSTVWDDVQELVEGYQVRKEKSSKITELSKKKNLALYNNALRMDSILHTRALNSQLFQNEVWRYEEPI